MIINICLWSFYWLAKRIWYSWSQRFTWKNTTLWYYINCIPLLLLGIYLYILIDDKLNWNTHTNNIVSKLMRANSILSKLRYYINIVILKNNLLCNIPFLSYLCHGSTGANKNSPETYNCPSKESIKNYELCTI